MHILQCSIQSLALVKKAAWHIFDTELITCRLPVSDVNRRKDKEPWLNLLSQAL